MELTMKLGMSCRVLFSAAFFGLAAGLAAACSSVEEQADRVNLRIGSTDVTCTVSTGAGQASGEQCEQSFESCSDGNQYAINCKHAETMTCTCSINGEEIGQFNAERLCPISVADTRAGCMW
jgi:hypothetical protein